MKHFCIFRSETFATKVPKYDESTIKAMLEDAGKAYGNWESIK